MIIDSDKTVRELTEDIEVVSLSSRETRRTREAERAVRRSGVVRIRNILLEWNVPLPARLRFVDTRLVLGRDRLLEIRRGIACMKRRR
jgi:hypothetical protein